MTWRVAVLLAVGVAFISAGLWLSPAPWSAFVFFGAALVAAGLLVDDGKET